MGDWINVKAKDVITILEKAKTGFPWGNYPDEKYRCLIFWYKNRINMTVNEFYNSNGETYSCCRFYTTELCLTIDEYNKKDKDEQIQYRLPFGGGAGARGFYKSDCFFSCTIKCCKTFAS